MAQTALRLAEEDAVRITEARLAAGVAKLRNASLVAGAADLALTAGVPVAVWVGVAASVCRRVGRSAVAFVPPSLRLAENCCQSG
jgi:hypothetical protein